MPVLYTVYQCTLPLWLVVLICFQHMLVVPRNVKMILVGERIFSQPGTSRASRGQTWAKIAGFNMFRQCLFGHSKMV